MNTCAPVHLSARALCVRAGGKPQGRALLTDLRFDASSGQSWVILGPNGAGKTTLLAVLAGLLVPSGGEVSVDGTPLSHWSAAELAQRRAWCPQFWSDPFAATVRETVALARGLTTWVEDSTTAALTHDLSALLADLELTALASTDVRQLSGGERQRVAVAAALWQGAPCLLLDEPASHLDLAHQSLLLGLLQRHRERAGLVMASVHDLNLAWALATHALLLDGRGAVRAGRRDEVMTPANLSDAFGVSVERDGNADAAFFRVRVNAMLRAP